MYGMLFRPQFTVPLLLVAMVWVAVWWLGVTKGEDFSKLLGMSFLDADRIQAILLVMPPPAILGLLCGRPYFGILCGLSSAFGIYLYTHLVTPVHT